MNCRALAGVLIASAAVALGGCGADSNGTARVAAVNKACQHFLQAFGGSWEMTMVAKDDADKARAEREGEMQVKAIGEMRTACRA